MPPMRIYFVGAHATGKTTMTRSVSRRYGLPMITEVARAVLAELETSLDSLRTDMELVAENQRRVFVRPHRDLLKEDGVRAGVTWESVLRIDGMIKLMLEQSRIPYLPIESASMQERARAVDFVLRRARS